MFVISGLKMELQSCSSPHLHKLDESDADDEREGFLLVLFLFLQELWKVTATPLPFDKAQPDSQLPPS